MSVDAFMDTHVFVHHLDATHPGKHAVAEQVVRRALSERNAYCISLQVPATVAVYQRALELRQRWRFSFYDSSSVARAPSSPASLPRGALWRSCKSWLAFLRF